MDIGDAPVAVSAMGGDLSGLGLDEVADEGAIDQTLFGLRGLLEAEGSHAIDVASMPWQASWSRARASEAKTSRSQPALARR
jgi:hypothetical protein